MEGSYNISVSLTHRHGFYHLGKWKGAITSVLLLFPVALFYHLGKWKGAITKKWFSPF